jgi:hypothetical protein
MNGFSFRLRQLGNKLKTGLYRFMAGRYGTDKLNTSILILGLILCVISMFLPAKGPVLVLTTLAYLCSFVVIFRAFSRNTYKRYRENRKYLDLIARIKDREHRYFACPKCKQCVRVPKGKGKIAISCPKCRERFIKKT